MVLSQWTALNNRWRVQNLLPKAQEARKRVWSTIERWHRLFCVVWRTCLKIPLWPCDKARSCECGSRAYWPRRRGDPVEKSSWISIQKWEYCLLLSPMMTPTENQKKINCIYRTRDGGGCLLRGGGIYIKKIDHHTYRWIYGEGELYGWWPSGALLDEPIQIYERGCSG